MLPRGRCHTFHTLLPGFLRALAKLDLGIESPNARLLATQGPLRFSSNHGTRSTFVKPPWKIWNAGRMTNSNSFGVGRLAFEGDDCRAWQGTCAEDINPWVTELVVNCTLLVHGNGWRVGVSQWETEFLLMHPLLMCQLQPFFRATTHQAFRLLKIKPHFDPPKFSGINANYILDAHPKELISAKSPQPQWTQLCIKKPRTESPLLHPAPPQKKVTMTPRCVMVGSTRYLRRVVWELLECGIW